MRKTVYILEMGILLDKSHPKFKTCNMIYDDDNLWGYFKKDEKFFFNKGKAVWNAEAYVANGIDFVYAVVLEDTIDLNEEEIEGIEETGLYIGMETCLYPDVVFSIYKDDKEKFYRNFIKV